VNEAMGDVEIRKGTELEFTRQKFCDDLEKLGR
jgi:hypothetical protein